MGAGGSSAPAPELESLAAWNNNQSLVPSRGAGGTRGPGQFVDASRQIQALENRAGDLEGASDGEAGSKLPSPEASAMSASVQQTDGMELTRTIEQLASANQQLASAHNLTLAHLRWLFAELTKVRSGATDTCPKCRSQEKEIKSSGKARTLLVKQSSIGKSAGKRSRRLRRLPNFDESRDGGDAEEQTLLVERLTRDYNSAREECERKEKTLEELTEKLNRSESESGRLLAELETFQGERLDAERLVKEAAEESNELRARLAEQEELGRKHLQQIRALELAVQATRRSPKSSEEDATSSSGQVQPANEEFKKELMLKREARQRAIAGISSEMERLRRELEAEKVAHAETATALESLRENQAKAVQDEAEKKTDDDEGIPERIEAIRLSDLLKVSDEIRSELWLQVERTDDLRFHLENEPDEHRVRIGSLRRLAEETRATLRTRKQQSNQLKDRLAQLLARLGDRAFLDDNDEIREEAERQLEDVARSRQLCDERSRILAELKDQCSKEVHELRVKLENSKKESEGLEEELHKTEDKMDAQDAEILNLESQLGLAKADCRDLQNQMSLINSLFTQMLLSASSAEMDLDRLTRLLQENHDLISGMAKETGSEAAALPKLLLDIIEQVDGRSRESDEKTEEDDQQQENIAHNLPKVWRVLFELLSCHAAESNSATASAAAESAPDSCYKSVDTPTGPRLVISVSKTYIRLKELILEKKHLEKEMNRMKQLNSHLETKLSEQEKRLSTVSDELSKTWNIVGRMQVQHQQLHTHEKILRYELQQKRKMLQELKQELEYCREKWESARQKNTNTEIEWRSLRREFAARKALANHSDSFNNSGESGFSDDREESDEDEDEGDVAKRVRPVNSRRRARKDGSRPSSPDTESEQPTDNELSEPKTASSLGSGQRTPTPETEAESEIIEEDPLPAPAVSDQLDNTDTDAVDPLDKALSNVIQSLISTNESEPTESAPSCSSSVQQIPDETVLPTESPVSIFSIGPFPSQSPAMKYVQFSNPLVMGPSASTPTTDDKVVPIADDRVTPVADDRVTPVADDRVIPIDDDRVTPVADDRVIPIDDDRVTPVADDRVIPIDDDRVTPVADDSISVDSSSSLETVREAIVPGPSTSSTSTVALDARAARLKSLEEQAEWLVRKVSDTNRRGSALSSRLEELHETYGSTPTAPPMPDVLPAFRISTEIADEPSRTDESDKTNDPDEATR